MSNFKQQAKDTRTPEEIAIQSAMNSHYNMMMPMLNAEHVRIHHPITALDYHFSTNDQKFYSMMSDLYSKGLDKKLQSEFDYFATLDSKWSTIKNQVDNYINSLNSGETTNV